MSIPCSVKNVNMETNKLHRLLDQLKLRLLLEHLKRQPLHMEEVLLLVESQQVSQQDSANVLNKHQSARPDLQDHQASQERMEKMAKTDKMENKEIRAVHWLNTMKSKDVFNVPREKPDRLELTDRPALLVRTETRDHRAKTVKMDNLEHLDRLETKDLTAIMERPEVQGSLVNQGKDQLHCPDRKDLPDPLDLKVHPAKMVLSRPLDNPDLPDLKVHQVKKETTALPDRRAVMEMQDNQVLMHLIVLARPELAMSLQM